jgi:outer membrane lipoprotein-sorting protein
MPLSNFQKRIYLGILMLTLAATSCVSKSEADARARAAYMAGQQAAYQSIQGTMTDVTFLGSVEKHHVPWATGLTLAQALAAANYTGKEDPQEIILKRNSVETLIDPKQLLEGRDVSLQPGDVVSVIGQ